MSALRFVKSQINAVSFIKFFQVEWIFLKQTGQKIKFFVYIF